jgi:hypothetical protein
MCSGPRGTATTSPVGTRQTAAGVRDRRRSTANKRDVSITDSPALDLFDSLLAILRDFCRKIKHGNARRRIGSWEGEPSIGSRGRHQTYALLAPMYGERGARVRRCAGPPSPLSSWMEATVGMASRPLAGSHQDVSRRRQLNPLTQTSNGCSHKYNKIATLVNGIVLHCRACRSDRRTWWAESSGNSPRITTVVGRITRRPRDLQLEYADVTIS